MVFVCVCVDVGGNIYRGKPEWVLGPPAFANAAFICGPAESPVGLPACLSGASLAGSRGSSPGQEPLGCVVVT